MSSRPMTKRDMWELAWLQLVDSVLIIISFGWINSKLAFKEYMRRGVL